MAIQPKELFSSTTVNPFPRVHAKEVLTKKCKLLAAAPLLAALTPMAVETSSGMWVPWRNDNTPAGSGTIRGFIYPEAHQLHATNETIATIMLQGEIHHDDVPVPSGETQNNLTAALKAGLGDRGIFVVGVTAGY